MSPNPPTAVEIGDNVTESWLCIDCGVNTAPGIPDGRMIRVLIELTGSCATHIGGDAEVYMVRKHIWKKAGMTPLGGCLCVGCLEKRWGRRLKPKDFPEHILNRTPGTPRLLERRSQ
jgi:hypothetical protein